MCFLLFYNSIAAVIYMEENGTAVDVLRRTRQLPCTPVVSCDVTSIVRWERYFDMLTNVSDMMSDDGTLTVRSKQYGRYRCYGHHDPDGLLYNAYGKMYSVMVLVHVCACVCVCVEKQLVSYNYRNRNWERNETKPVYSSHL